MGTNSIIIGKIKMTYDPNGNPNHKQQGDVWLNKIEAIPANTNLSNKVDKHILAEGEVTGHHHKLVLESPDDVLLYEGPDNKTFLDIKTDTVLVHEEHGPINIDAGFYEFGQINEFDYSRHETIRVFD